jgi:hypothetical protein
VEFGMSNKSFTMSQKADRDAERYLKRYRDHIEVLESKSVLSKVRSITPFDIQQLGERLEAFDDYVSICEEDGTIAQLGKIPHLAYDILTVNYGTSPISVISSLQTIEDESGSVYLRSVTAQTTRGNVTAGQSFANATSVEDVSPMGFASAKATQIVGDTVAGTTEYDFTVDNKPIRPFKVSITVNGMTAKDDGNGLMSGYGIQGTINYQTGEGSVRLVDDPAAVYPISVTSYQNFEQAENIPQVGQRLTAKSVSADLFVMKETVGIEMIYAMRRRFGVNVESEIATTLISAINNEQVNTTVYMLRAAAMGNTTWNKTPDTGVSAFDHKQSFKDKIADADAVMLGNAGRGAINGLIAGRSACALMSTLPGFTKLSDGLTIGPHIFGTLDGMTVVRIPSTTVLPSNEIIGFYNSGTPFEAPSVLATYMPLVMTTALPHGLNPLVNQRAACVWAAIEVLVPQFVTRITITEN